MFKTRGRLIALGAIAVALAVAATLAHSLLPPRKTRDVAVPPPNATPEQVVETYLDALNAHDCATAQALVTVGARESAKTWCDDVARLTDVALRDHFIERPRLSGHSPPEEVANVPVTFNLSWRLFHDDGSMDEGYTTWAYLLVRESADSPWRIFDQGVG